MRKLLSILTICLLPVMADAQAQNGVTVVYPPGECRGLGKQIEIGTYKPELDQPGEPPVVWTRSPRQFVSLCGTSIEKEFTARYRLRVRCVDKTTKDPLGPWVASLSSVTQPWPAECPPSIPAPAHIVPEQPGE